MTTRLALIVSLGMTLAAAGIGVALYSSLPEALPVHWGLNGEVDGWAPKAAAVWGSVGFMALFALLIPILRAISPRPFEVEKFEQTYNQIMTGIVGLGAFLFAVIVAAGLYPDFNSGRVLIAGLFLFFALLGNVMGKVQRNFWIGVRTPWTLANERVWDITHRSTARLWFVGGLIGAVAILLGVEPAWCFWFLIVIVLWPLLQSFLVWRRLERG